MREGDKKEQWDREQSFKKKLFLGIKCNQEAIWWVSMTTDAISA